MVANSICLSREMPRKDGIDTSKWNGVINWSCVKTNTGGRWSACQVLDRNSSNIEDSQYRASRAGMASAGFSHRMLYYFPVLDGSLSVATQVDQYLRAIGTFAVGEGPMFDAEDDSNRGPVTEELTYEWCDRAEQKCGRPVAVYTGLYVNGGRIWNSTRIFNGHRARILAYYTTDEQKVLNAAKPYVPDAWQWSGTGSLCGTSPLDLDQINNLAAFDASCGYGTVPVGSDDALHLVIVKGTNAKFVGMFDEKKFGHTISWVRSEAEYKQYEMLGAPKRELNLEDLFGLILLGPLPIGDTLHNWTGAEFDLVIS